MNGSRRESRSSLGNRQNDALFEFETFKKKFLLANKHIAKLNSTLSVRIEELNAQISMLYVENLRLRASEIALASQLKREREQSRKILVDAEAASQRLTKHLSYLRESLHDRDEPGAPPTPPSPKARRPPVHLNFDPLSPQFRIARPPNIPGIYEDEEPCASSIGQPEITMAPPRKKPKTKSKASGSKLPLPARSSSPPVPLTEEASSQRLDLSNLGSSVKPRKTIRRQSGLLKVTTETLAVPRSGSPAFGSPIRLEAGLAEEEEEIAAIHGELEVLVPEQEEQDEIVNNDEKDKEKRKGRLKEQPDSEKKRSRTDEPTPASVKRSKSRNALQPIDNNVEEAIDTETKLTSQRQFLRPPSPSRDSSSPTPFEQADGVGREKRVRKSVNYAEPKLNTKMRKPDLPPGTEPSRKKRSSAAAVMSTPSQKPAPSSSTTTDDIHDLAIDTEKRTAQEDPLSQPVLPLRGVSGNYIDPGNFGIPSSRPGSAAAMYSPGPPTRTTGSSTASSSTSTASSSSSVVSTNGIGRPKSRPQLPFSEDDSDGADADAEHIGSGHMSSGSSSGWGNVNVESGRRRVPKRSAAAAAVAALEDIRRHSMAL